MLRLVHPRELGDMEVGRGLSSDVETDTDGVVSVREVELVRVRVGRSSDEWLDTVGDVVDGELYLLEKLIE